MSIEGEAYELPPGVDLAAFRIIQEALTNALRHSGAAHAAVVVREKFHPTKLDVAVEDDGVGMDGHRPKGDTGWLGVRERVALYGGTVEVVKCPDGGRAGCRPTLPVRDNT